MAGGGTPKPAVIQTPLDDVQLSFNKAHFSRPDFDLERFLSLTRRRATLEDLHNDLKLYLKVVQNSMIELINDDYADFVNLSSNLVSLHDSIGKIKVDVNNNYGDLKATTAVVEKSAQIVEEKYRELAANNKEQVALRDRISLVVALKTLNSMLSDKPAELSDGWLDSLSNAIVAVQHWFNGDIELEQVFCEAREKCLNRSENCLSQYLCDDLKKGETMATYVPRILSILRLIKRTAGPIETVGKNVLCPLIEFEAGEELDKSLERAINVLKGLQMRWFQTLDKSLPEMELTKVISFLDQCIVSYMLKFLDENYGSVLVPSDNSLFHKCFNLIGSFIQSFPMYPECAPILRKIREKFNSIVYFKLETQHYITLLVDQMVVNEFSYSLEDDDRRLTRPSATIFKAIRNCYSSEVYLTSLSEKFWDFIMKMLRMYAHWIDRMHRRFTGASALDLLGESEMWKCLVVLTSDVQKFDEDLFDFVNTNVYPLITPDTTVFGQCITVYCNELTAKRDALDQVLVEMLVGYVNSHFICVLNIPRQYRWTKKPTPSDCSEYISTGFMFIRQFLSFATLCDLEEEWTMAILNTVLKQSVTLFYKNVEQVLCTVEQTEQSLKRFKKKGAVVASDESSEPVTDECKIRSQLRLDLKELGKQASSYGIAENVTLLQTLSGTEESD